MRRFLRATISVFWIISITASGIAGSLAVGLWTLPHFVATPGNDSSVIYRVTEWAVRELKGTEVVADPVTFKETLENWSRSILGLAGISAVSFTVFDRMRERFKRSSPIRIVPVKRTKPVFRLRRKWRTTAERVMARYYEGATEIIVYSDSFLWVLDPWLQDLISEHVRNGTIKMICRSKEVVRQASAVVYSKIEGCLIEAQEDLHCSFIKYDTHRCLLYRYFVEQTEKGEARFSILVFSETDPSLRRLYDALEQRLVQRNA